MGVARDASAPSLPAVCGASTASASQRRDQPCFPASPDSAPRTDSGRPRRADDRAQEPGGLQVGVCPGAHLQPRGRAVGAEGLHGLLWCVPECPRLFRRRALDVGKERVGGTVCMVWMPWPRKHTYSLLTHSRSHACTRAPSRRGRGQGGVEAARRQRAHGRLHGAKVSAGRGSGGRRGGSAGPSTLRLSPPSQPSQRRAFAHRLAVSCLGAALRQPFDL